ncbi:alpha/beta hydrolase [Legionella clemsonensis]|uniref:Thermostable monoacylglycerol lipase n=1 Tax=Legionella clemsonensis TaxID=1867846 RepID=A0A222NYT2_9GAMM|nr:alpha/beta fold hydrolase [Legionella clemsonensis]ASQ44750.1 Thermostable monoacylglycerol lipase [Legionella clemsonensis]
MNIDDFRAMRRGIPLFALDKKDVALMAPIERRNGEKKRALLLLHGFTSTPAVFRVMLPSLTFYDAILCPVLPGHADTLKAFAEVKAEAWLKTAEQSCELMLNEFEQVDVLGLSLGGILACHLSNQFKLHHLYLLAPALDLRLPLEHTLKLAKFLTCLGFQEVRGLSGDLFTNQHCEIAYRKLPLAAIIEIFNLIKQLSFNVPDCPTDVFLGCHDKVVSSWRVAARFANKDNVRIHWLSNSAHVIPLDGDIEQIIACMKEHLQ